MFFTISASRGIRKSKIISIDGPSSDAGIGACRNDELVANAGRELRYLIPLPFELLTPQSALTQAASRRPAKEQAAWERDRKCRFDVNELIVAYRIATGLHLTR
ncbi:hypothetical protein [Allomesorhizobium camelthorni]|uniref:Uncharacterized protein n=1 Tax=Allomesorhizobium camelthorni TaxID=475069 RepID=A0A6G4WBB4_9HYPH|nr:hypothetical protein [Mesorhizobium camelthorni]NGO52085.1 hypothetical protein [Mesorhizobium camelthorni]